MSRTPVKEVLHIAGIPLEEQLRIVMRERDELAHEVRQITRYQEVNGTAGVGSAWQQMGATTRELRRVEDELLVVKARNQQLEGSARQTSDLLETIARLESQSQRSDTLLAVLREELRESKHESHQLKEAHLASEQRLQRAKTESGGREESFKATIVERDLKIVELEIQIKTMASMASMKEIVSVPKTLQMIQPEVSSIAVEQLELEIRGLQTRLTESETQRRALLRKVQDLRGNVRVMVRLRPRLQGEGGEEDCIQCHPDGRSLQLHGDVRGAEQIFTLDQIFGSRSTQENIYQELNDLVQSAMDGYRICLLSYGQTGSGKTFTMTGGSGSERGIVPRAMEQLLRQAGSMRADGWEVNISMSFVELYNEVFRDLLNPEAGSRVKVGLANERVTISGLSTETLDSGGLEAGLTHLQQLLDKAVSARTVACTLLNETSSRSHMIFLIDITCRHPNGSILLGGLRFADLAGSERLDRTGTASDAARLRETTSINKSLSCLGDVFSAIGSKQSHVPYRNSKLTTILQDCFTGDGKTLLLVSISPTLASAGETLCSLRFATQVNRVELGKASKNAFLAPPAHLLPPLPPAISVNESTAVVKPSQLLGSALLTDRSRPLKRAMHAIEEDAEVENRYAPNGALSFLSSSRGYKSTAGGGGGATKRISTFLHGSFVGRESVAPSSGSSHSFLSGANAMSSRNDTTASFPAVERRKLFTRPTGGGGWR